MKKLLSTVIQISFAILFGFSITYQKAAASSWPIFLPPDYQTLLKLNYIDTSQCPMGQGQLIAHPLINIQQHLCRNFCPGEWEWVGYSDNQCHNLSDFKLRNIEIAHYPDENNTSHSVITVDYGKINSNKSLASFSMMTQPGKRWYCVIISQNKQLLSCANDVWR